MKACVGFAIAIFALGCQPTDKPVDIAPQRQAIDKARNVEQTLQDSADQRRKNAEEQESR